MKDKKGEDFTRKSGVSFESVITTARIPRYVCGVRRGGVGLRNSKKAV